MGQKLEKIRIALGRKLPIQNLDVTLAHRTGTKRIHNLCHTVRASTFVTMEAIALRRRCH